MSRESDRESAEKKKAERALARITQQFRGANNMTYELECEGQRLIVRIFPVQEGPEAWRIEAQTRDAPEANVASATAASRSKAFDEVVLWWRENALAKRLETFDWEAVGRALSSVKAL